MTERLEEQLSRVLIDRAGTIERAPAYRLVPVGATAPRTRRRIRWQLIASAAAVAALVAALVSLVGARDDHRRSAPPTNGAKCVLTNSPRFTSALQDGRLPRGAEVLSGDSAGTLLAGVQRAGATVTVELITPTGWTTPIWTAGPGERMRAVASPFAAITEDEVAFVLAPLGSGESRFMVAPRTSDVAAPVPGPAPGYRFAADPMTAPIIDGETIQVLEVSTANPSRQRVDAYWPEASRWTLTAQGTNVSAVLPVGGNLLMLRQQDGAVDVQFDDATYRPTTLARAVREGFSFASDGTTLTWLTDQGGRPVFWQWAPGDPTPEHRALPGDLTPVSSRGQLVVGEPSGAGGGRPLVDVGTGRAAQLPPDVDLVRVDSGIAVLAQRSAGDVTYAKVPTALLTRC